MPPEDLPKETVGGNDSAFVPTQSTDSADSAVKVIGPYHLVRRLGEGGMGEVWLAEQKEPVRRRVALKLIKAGLSTREAMARFDSERQALALMDHPAIAKVFDAGATSQGTPYFVMEYVAGVPITEYCDRHKLNTRERLDLFTQVCEGVQHAHQKAIIHRDLKPSNILVTEVDGHPAAKIIDFGVAKALTQRLTDETMFTRAGALVGTPEYMSPEQASSSGEDVDTRTDVYSLGIIFYELLAGTPPIELRKIALEEFLRRLREEDPLKPSTKISSDDENTSTEVALKRKTEPATLARQLRGELDSIALKALEKERSRRYASASEFAADIKRYLNHEPVLAVAPSLAYRARKFARRHRVGLTTAAAFVLVLLVAAVVSVRQSIRANREAAISGRVVDFMTQMFKVSDPSQARGNSITAREILDKASEQIDTGLARDPEVQARLLHTMGKVYLELGIYPRAEALLRQSVAIGRRVFGPKDRDTLVASKDLAWTLLLESHIAEAEQLQREALEIQRENFGPDDPNTLSSMNSLAAILTAEGRFPEAEKLYRETVEGRRRVLGPENEDTLNAMGNLGLMFLHVGRYPEAEDVESRTLEIQRRVLGRDHPETEHSMDVLASILSEEHRYAEAEKLYRETLESRRRVFGPEHPDTLRAMDSLGFVLTEEGRPVEAEKLLREALDIERRFFPPDAPTTLATMNILGTALGIAGHYDEAIKMLLQTRDTQVRTLGRDSPYTAATTYNVACMAARGGRREQALSFLSEAVDHGLEVGTDLNLEGDSDLTSLHGDPRFTALVAHAKEVAEQKQKAISLP